MPNSAKLHALRFRCGVCHYASNEKYPDFDAVVEPFRRVVLIAEVTCPRCRTQHRIKLAKVPWKEEKHA
jgi:transposase-like protein